VFLFDKFFSRHYWGITDYDRKVTPPRLIRAKYKTYNQFDDIDITAISAGSVKTYYNYKLLTY